MVRDGYPSHGFGGVNELGTQRDLWVCYFWAGLVALVQGVKMVATEHVGGVYRILVSIDQRGIHPSPDDCQWLEYSRDRLNPAECRSGGEPVVVDHRERPTPPSRKPERLAMALCRNG